VSRDIEKYFKDYSADYGFESVVVAYRQRFLTERLNLAQAKVIVEIGCGSELLAEAWIGAGGRFDQWIIIEPAEELAATARSSGIPNLFVIQGLFEGSIADVLRLLAHPPDMVICSSLLHEVPCSHTLLMAVRAVMGRRTRLHVNVPNSESLHRRLGVAMALAPRTTAMSPRNKKLMQHRVYDMAALRSEIAASAMRITDEGGYLAKPFSHSQMERLLPDLGFRVMDGLFELGKIMPDYASEIWAEARLDGDA